MADEEAIWDDDSGHVVRIKRRMVVDECDDDDELTRMDAWHFSGGEPAVPLFPKPTLTRSPSEYVRTQAAEEESTTMSKKQNVTKENKRELQASIRPSTLWAYRISMTERG